jgi:hypothetical protein
MKFSKAIDHEYTYNLYITHRFSFNIYQHCEGVNMNIGTYWGMQNRR